MSQENKKLRFCTASLALNSRVGEASRKNKAFYSPETQHGRRVRKVYRPFPSCFEPHNENEAKCKPFLMKISFVCLWL